MKSKAGKGLAFKCSRIIPVSAIAIFLVFIGCNEKNYPPEAILEVSPVSGDTPLQVRIQLTGTDPNGTGDITRYKLTVDKEVITRYYTFDITKTFINPGTVTIYGEVFDSQGATDKAESSVVVNRRPYVEQSAALDETGVGIKYSATLSKIPKAKLKVEKEGVGLISTEEISDINPTGPDFEKTYSYTLNPKITKGNYEFTLTSDNVENVTQKDSVVNYIVIPNYKPSITNLNAVNNIKLMEGADSTITLQPDDKNPEDKSGIAIKSVTSLDNKLIITQPKGYTYNIEAVPGQSGTYQYKVVIGSESGGLEETVLGGEITKDTRIKIDPFVSTDPNGAEYNALTQRADMDNFILTKLGLNNGNTIPPSTKPSYNCANYSFKLFVDSKNLGEKIRAISSDFGKYWLYNNYRGHNLDSIYKNGGTREEEGTIGAPIIMAILVDTSHYASHFGHSMNGAATGKDIRKWEDWNFIEPQKDKINVQIGGWNIPKDCDEVILTYPLLVEDNINGNYIKFIDLVEFRIENGNPILIWENKDPNYNIIKQRGK